jgi:hypothetical protein
MVRESVSIESPKYTKVGVGLKIDFSVLTVNPKDAFHGVVFVVTSGVLCCFVLSGVHYL